MTTDAQSAREDLAFLRALVEGSGRPDAAPGKFFVVTGVAWGFDALVHWVGYAGLFGLEPMSGWQRIAFDGVVTTIWLVLAIRLRWGAPERDAAQGAAARAYAAAAGGVGASILAMLAVLLTAAARLDLGAALLLYAPLLFVFFGAIWLGGFFLWRRPWRLAVALGWFAAAVGMVGAGSIPTYIAIAGLAMLLLMALPGAIMWRAATEARP